MVSIGALYHMTERMFATTMYSVRLVNLHFWMATIGTAIYITAMWVAGIMQGLMWRAYDDYGNLAYIFVESVSALHPYYAMRAVGGLIFFLGAVIMLFNITMTIRRAKAQPSAELATAANI
jgi:cytochrome c oxidase cbb3-type subunit 1